MTRSGKATVEERLAAQRARALVGGEPLLRMRAVIFGRRVAPKANTNEWDLLVEAADRMAQELGREKVEDIIRAIYADDLACERWRRESMAQTCATCGCHRGG